MSFVKPLSLAVIRERQAILYLDKKWIHDIIDFLIINLLSRRPSDPYEYLSEFLERHILSRSNLADASHFQRPANR